MPKPKPEISARAKRVWQRMREWYGVRVVDSFGETPPEDWCRVIDAADNSMVQRGLQLMRQRHLQHPPSLPQFEQLIRPPAGGKPAVSEADQLCAYVVKSRKLTALQLRTHWTYSRDKSGELIVTVPADDPSPAINVSALEMRSGQQELAP